MRMEPPIRATAVATLMLTVRYPLELLSCGTRRAAIADRATSIENETAAEVTSEALSERLAENLVLSYDVLIGPDGPTKIREEWRRRSSYFSGRSVRVATGSQTVTGITDGLEDNGALRVRQDDGTVAIIQTGDVERLRTGAD